MEQLNLFQKEDLNNRNVQSALTEIKRIGFTVKFFKNVKSGIALEENYMLSSILRHLSALEILLASICIPLSEISSLRPLKTLRWGNDIVEIREKLFTPRLTGGVPETDRQTLINTLFDLNKGIDGLLLILNNLPKEKLIDQIEEIYEENLNLKLTTTLFAYNREGDAV